MGKLPRWFLMVGIVTAPMGCDNVSWGGMSIRLDPPPGDTVEGEGEGGIDATEPPPLEYGPLLYAGVRTGDSATLVPVAELADGQLHALPRGEDALRLSEQIRSNQFRTGRRFVLLHGGNRIGNLTVAESDLAPVYCPPRPRASGRLELVPSAMEATRFLALDQELAETEPALPFQALEPTRAHRNAAQNLAGEALNELQAPWPAGLQTIREDLQVFRLDQQETPWVVATFAYQDQMAVAPPADEAYSLLVMGEPTETGLRRAFTWYRPVALEGKGVPMFFSWMDWDDDDEGEVVLEILGADARWWAALDRGPDGWSVTFEDSCGQRGVSPGSPRP